MPIYGTNGNDNLSGGNGQDTIYGLDGDDIISGGNGIDTLFGDGGNDQLTGDHGDDNLTGGADDDVLDGLNGFDTAYYSGAIGEYSFFAAAGYLHIVHLGGAGADGHDQVTNVERLVFADRTIDIGSNNNRPVAGDDLVFIDEDTGTYSSGAASVLDNDFDFDGDALTVTAGVFVGTYGTLTLNADGTYSYTLTANLQGMDDGETVTDSFNYTVTDDDGSDTGALVFNIAGLNDAPVANDDTNSTTEDAVASGNVLTNDTDVDVEPLVVTNPGTYVGAYGTLVLNADGSYTYTPNAAAQALDDGEVVSDAFGYTASDGTASDTATLTITVTGLNDAPVANDDSNSTTEDGTASGNVLANDTDVDVEPLTVTNPGTYVGTYGTLVLAADGSYTYTPNAAAQGLDDGEVVSDAFGYTASDGTASDTATLTIDVTGLNDAPVANDDTNSTTEDGTASGNVLANDTDVDVEPLTVTTPGTYVGTYGTLVLAADGSYTYTPNAGAQALDDGEVVSDAFGYTASDGTASDTATLTIDVTGLNDAPVANDDTNSTSEDSAVSGNVLTNDTDVDVEPLTVTNPGTYAGTFGTLVLAADGSYTYTPNATANGLAAGETAQDAFGYTASDGTASDTATLTVTVNGANDAPTIDAGGTDDSGSVTELPNNDPNENGFTHTDSGTVAFDDVDVTDTHSASFTPQGGGYLGSFTLDPVNQAGDTVGWDFNVEDSDLDFLDDGETLTQIYTIEIDDGNGGTVTQDITITLTGAADGPQTEWYIDNSAAGSANIGTQADPFTSIAAFNAAQGTMGGPQVGATVYLLAGTGTYAEADGINLLDGQTLTGVAAGPLRPTISASAGDGIDVAENNTVSGVDIGTTSGAGIDDDGGTVGTLTVSDVGKSGGGQIVDIDNGGTLNVTLNSAASTGSTGGAIDLNNLSGSFTVTGATSVTGAHGGGAVDITGGTLTSAFSGGLTITTTSGFGLSAQSSGSVAVNGGTISTIGAGAVNLTSTDSAGITLTSVSSTGGTASGIVLNNAGSGGFTVTGTGSVAGSGGTISGKTGADFVFTTGVGVYINATDNVALANMTISTNANGGIVGINVDGFTLTDSTLNLGNGSNSGEGSIAFTNLTGTAALLGNVIGGASGDNVRIENTTGSLDLTIADSADDAAIVGLNNNVTGLDGVSITTSGSAALTLTIDGVDFQGARSDLLQINASDSSSQDIVITDSNFTNLQASSVGGGVVLTGGGGGSNITVDYRIEGSTFTGAVGNALTANYTHQAGTVRGYISLNQVGVDDGITGTEGSTSGGGIVVGLEKAAGAGDAAYYVIIADNEVRDIDSGLGGIEIRSSGGDATDTATVEAIVSGNVVEQMGANALAAVYALVGGTGVDFAALGLEIDDNVFDASGALLNAVFLDQISPDAHYYFPGYAGSPDGEFNGGTASADIGAYLSGRGNVMLDGAFATFPGDGVDAGIVFGVTGDPVAPAWYP